MYQYLLWALVVLALLASPNFVHAEHQAPTVTGISIVEGITAPIHLHRGGGLGGQRGGARFEMDHLPLAFFRHAEAGDLFHASVHPLPSGPNTRFTLRHLAEKTPWGYGSLQGLPGALSMDPRYRLSMPRAGEDLRITGPALQRALKSGEIVRLDGWCLITWAESPSADRTVSWLAWRPASGATRCED